jgi:Uma2 family endonuclease
MATLLADKLYILEEFEDFLRQHGERRYELIYGEIIEKMPPEQHGVISLKIGARLLAFVEQHQIKAHVGVEVRYERPEDRYNSRIPNVSLRLTDEPLTDKGAVLQMPDLAVEVQSPDDDPHDLREKASYYLHKGSRLVWLIYPNRQQVEVCRLDANSQMEIVTLNSDEMLTGGDVLTGFHLLVADIFPRG